MRLVQNDGGPQYLEDVKQTVLDESLLPRDTPSRGSRPCHAAIAEDIITVWEEKLG